MVIAVMEALLAICGDCPDDIAIVNFPCQRVQGALALLNHAYHEPMPEGHFVCPYPQCDTYRCNLEQQMPVLVAMVGSVHFFPGIDDVYTYVSQLGFLLTCTPAVLAPPLYYAAALAFEICEEVKRIIVARCCTDNESRLLKEKTQNLKQLLCQLRKLAFFEGRLKPPRLPLAKGITFG